MFCHPMGEFEKTVTIMFPNYVLTIIELSHISHISYIYISWDALVSLYLNNQFLGSHILTGYKFGNTQSNGVLF